MRRCGWLISFIMRWCRRLISFIVWWCGWLTTPFQHGLQRYRAGVRFQRGLNARLHSTRVARHREGTQTVKHWNIVNIKTLCLKNEHHPWTMRVSLETFITIDYSEYPGFPLRENLRQNPEGMAHTPVSQQENLLSWRWAPLPHLGKTLGHL